MKFQDKAALSKWALETPSLWLFLDYDGTLVDFTPSPEQVIPQSQIINLFIKLSQKPNLRITILSGRRLNDLQILFPMGNIYLAGLYGIDLITPTGERLNRVKYNEFRPFIESIENVWEKIIFKRAGFILEDKGTALALHARFADDQEAAQIIHLALNEFEKIPERDIFKLIIGEKFLEIAPLLASKRETVNYLVDRFPLKGMELMYLGDDDKDEDAFTAVHEHGGVAIKVKSLSNGPLPSQADFWFNSPAETVEWLNLLAERIN